MAPIINITVNDIICFLTTLPDGVMPPIRDGTSNVFNFEKYQQFGCKQH